MTVFAGGLRVFKANCEQSECSVFIKRPEALTNAFFMNLPDMGAELKTASKDADLFEERDCKTGKIKWTGTRVDLVSGSDSGSQSKVYGRADVQQKFVHDFVADWDKVMNLDRFDLE